MPVAVILIVWMFGKSFWKSLEQGREKIFESKAWKWASGALPREPADINLDEVPSTISTKWYTRARRMARNFQRSKVNDPERGSSGVMRSSVD
jgi:hypothetical protein